MKIMLVAAIGIILGQMSMSLITNMNDVAYQRGVMSRNSEGADILIDAGQAVRSAYEIYQNTGGACPSGTSRREINAGKNLCWPTGASPGGANDESGCYRSKAGSRFCIWFGSSVARNADGFPWGELGWFPRAHAQYFSARSPASGGPAGGARLVIPSCSDSSTGCISCGNANTTCITIVFCVNAAVPCTNSADQWIQTLAFRRF